MGLTSAEQLAGSSVDAIVDLAAELIRIPSENPPGVAYDACVALLCRSLEQLGLPAERIPLGDDRTAVIAGAGKGRPVYLHGHYDVVPATVDGQFEPVVRDGRLYGRGSADMKGAIAAMMHAVAALAGDGFPGRVELVLVPDEETGGRTGTRRLLELGRLDPQALGAVLGEPTGGVIWNGSRGALTARVSLRGVPAHVGLHFEGVNAFEGAAPVVQALLAWKQDLRSRKTDFHIEPAEARESILMLGGEARGGHQFNLVPDAFSFTVERRFNPEEDLAAEREHLLRVVRESVPAGVGVEVDVFQEAPSSSVPESAPLVIELSKAVEAVTGELPRCELCPGLLETRFYGEAGIPAVAYGPGDLAVSHGPEESVELARLEACARIYAACVKRLAGL